MGYQISQLEIRNTLAEDPRWLLVERIVASPYFVRSERLCSFLGYICEQSLQGRGNEINETAIGAQLFDRLGYDPAVDGLVRSHASRMRQRLEQYFSNEGSQEPIRLVIPKGAYIPVFVPRPSEETPLEMALLEETLSVVRSTEAKDETEVHAHPKNLLLWILSAALAVMSITTGFLLVHLRAYTSEAISHTESHPLWRMLFEPEHRTTIVFSDASLALLQNVTERSVKLPEYINSSYQLDVAKPVGATPELVKDLASRRYTSIVDVGILTSFYRVPGIHPDRIQIRYARDVRPDDLKDGSTVLLGTQESNPWVEIFEPHMNFVFRDDLRRQNFKVINRSPRDNELSQYFSDRLDPLHTVYGVAALRPNLNASGHVLLLEGTSMAGTEAAATFVFEDALLLPFLHKIKNPDDSIPNFEVLLRSNNVNGNASQVEIVAYRTSKD